MNISVSHETVYGALLEYSKRVYFRFDDNPKSNFFVVKWSFSNLSSVHFNCIVRYLYDFRVINEMSL